MMIDKMICLISTDYEYLWMQKQIHNHAKDNLNCHTYGKTYLCYFTWLMMGNVQVYASLVKKIMSNIKIRVRIHRVKDVEENIWWRKLSHGIKS